MEIGDTVVCIESKDVTVKGKTYPVLGIKTSKKAVDLLDLGFKSIRNAPGQVDDINWQSAKRFIKE